MKKKTWFILAGAALVAVAAFVFFQFQNSQKSLTANLQIVTVERGNLSAEIGATGTVRANQTAQLVWSTSGVIDEINVELSQSVAADQVLASLSRGSLSQSIILAEADLVNARKSLEDLQNSSTQTAKAKLALAQAQIAYEDALEDLQSKQFQRASQATLDGLKADLILAENTLDSAEELFEGVADRAEDDPIRATALSQLSNARKAYDRAKYNFEYANALPDSNEVEEAQAKVDVAKASLEDAEREWEHVKNGVDADEIAAAEARVAAAEATLDTQYIQSPFSGTITAIHNKEGDQVNPNTAAFRIDDLSKLLVDVNLSEIDINQVTIGQSARLTFDAIQGKEYQGEVVEIARVGTTTPNGVEFQVTIELSEIDDAVLPGMTAAVDIITKRIDDVLLVPNRAVRRVDGKQVVYKLIGGEIVPVEIEIGAYEETYSQVISGNLQEGDQIIANPSSDISFTPGSGGRGIIMGAPSR